MARGITERDVFTACDSLLLAGERPTIERVRQKIGRGSPNTVSPMLDAWFKGLGRRLQDPGAFAPPPEIPEPVLQAAQHFWEVSQVSARVDLEAQVLERLGPMQVEVERAQHLAALAKAEWESTSNKALENHQQLTDLAARLEAERAGHAATAVRVEAAQLLIDDLATRLEKAEAQAQTTVERASLETKAAHERAKGAERRAAMEIESERSARGKADKRAEGLERRVEDLHAASAKQVEELARLRAELNQERAISEELRSTIATVSAELKVAEAALIDAKVTTGRAEAEAEATRAAMNKLIPMLVVGKQKKAVKPKQTATGY